ncbi:MAG: filamentous hemagglutinin N-terminal domain-containing protein [Oceanospirillales bacterium]|nr:filamentous hemagglutinin N-terminal domain-containing protein [Oceanospirillales bacterium]MBR9886505.1 filamentous hemagglutinin N-terminal domain-containing protein [Oceanospirillales bacterium]
MIIPKRTPMKAPQKKTYEKRLLSTLISGICMGAAPSYSYAAGIQADSSAPANNQAGVSESLNGTQVLNIVSPNTGGLSHNKFQDFNVQQQGLVINNSNINGVSQIGGAVVANPNLAGGEASLILNEVTSGNRSSLQGPQELLGAQAGYILANPNGITCNGCGFINFPRATLTTGTPVLGGGTVTGFDVNGGDVLIDVNGLNAKDITFFDIVSRSMEINGQINAQDLNLIAGRNSVDYATRTATAKADDGSAGPAFAIDSSLLGGMYVNRIKLIGTEAGVGVRLRGDIAASVDDITLDANGQIVFSGNDVSAMGSISVASTQSAATAGDEIELNGVTMYAANNVSLSGGDITQTDARTGAGNNITISGRNYTDTGGTRDAGNNLTLTATGSALLNGSTLQAANVATVSANTLSLTNGGLLVAGDSGTGDLDVSVTQNLNLIDGGLISGNTASVDAAVITIYAASNASGAKGIHSVAAGSVTASTSIDNAGYIGADSALTLSSPVLNNKAGGVITSTGTVSLSDNGVSGTALTTEASSEIKGNAVTIKFDTLSNAGTVYGKTSAELTADMFTNTGTLTSPGTITLRQKNTGGSLNNSAGDIEADVLSLTFDSLNNSGKINAITSSTLTVDTLTNSGVGAEIYSSGDLWIDALINGTTLNNTLGTIKADTLKLGFDTITNTGTLFGTQSWGLITGTLTNSGTISSLNTLTLQQKNSADTLTNTGNIDAGILSVNFKTIANTGGTLFANSAQTLTATTLTNSGDITSAGTSDLMTTTLTNSGNIVSVGAADITATTLNNTGKIGSSDTLNLVQSGSGTFNNQAGGVVNSKEALTLTFDTLTNTNEIVADKNATLTVNSLTNNDVISSKNGLLTLMQSGVGELINTSGSEISGNALDIDFNSLTNDGLISGTTAAAFNASGSRGTTLTNNVGGVIVADDLDIFFDTIYNKDKLFGYTTLDLGATDLTNNGGIHSTGTMGLSVTHLTNTPSATYAADIIALGDLVINDNNTLINKAANGLTPRIISKTGSLTINSTSGSGVTQNVINDGGFLFAKTGMDIDVSRLFTNKNNARLYSHSGTLHIGATSSADLQAATQSVTVENIDSMIENYLGDIDIVASIFRNSTSDSIPVVNTVASTVTSGTFVDQDGVSHSVSSNCGTKWDSGFTPGDTCVINYSVTDQQLSFGVSSAPKSKVLAGNDLYIWLESTGLNQYSTLSAGRDLTIEGAATASFTNEALTLTDTSSAMVMTDTSGGSAVAANFASLGIVCGGLDYSVGSAGSACYWVLEDAFGTGLLTNSEYYKAWLPTFKVRTTFTKALDATVEAGRNITVNVALNNNNGLSSADFVKGFAEGGNARIAAPSSTSNSDTITITVNDQGTNLSPLSVTDSVDTASLPSISISPVDLSPLVLDGIISLASSPFFTATSDPTSPFLFETDPTLMSLAGLYSSDLFIDSLGLDPDENRRLGDAYYEQQLIREQILAEAGQRFIADGLIDENDQYRYLLENGLQANESLSLRLGIALTAEQINNLQKDIVWMVETEVNGEKVLVPQLFLSSATRANIAEGAKFVARNIDVVTDGVVTNSGAFIASDDLSIDAGSVTNHLGTIAAGNALSISATENIINESGTISGNDVSLTTENGSIINTTLTTETEHAGAFGSGTNTQISQTATIEARGDLTLNSGEDIVSEGGDVSAGGNATLNAENDITFTGIENKTYSESFTVEGTADGGTSTESVSSQTNENIGSGLTVGGNLAATAKNDITIEGSTVDVGGDGSLDAGGDIIITAKEESSNTHTQTASGKVLNGTTDDVTVDQTTGDAALLLTGGSLSLNSGGDTNVVGSDIGVAGDLNVEGVGGDLNITAFEEKTTIHSEHTEGALFGGGSASADLGENNVTPTVKAEGTLITTTSETLHIDSTTHRGSNIIVGGNLNAGGDAIQGDANIVGSNIATGGDLNLSAQGDINVLAAEDTTTITSTTSTDSFNISGEASTNGAEGGFGFQHDDTSGNATQTTSQVSSLSAGNNITLNAGGDFTEQGTQVAAGGDISVEADSINSLAAQDTYTENGESLSVSVGLGAKADLGLGAVVDSFVDDKGKAKFDMADATNSINSLKVPDAGDVSANLSVSVTKTTTTGNGNTATGSSFSSGGNTSFTAREGDATFEGTNVDAGGDITVSADKGSINILTAQSSTASTSDTTQVDVEVGVSGDGTVSGSGSGGTSHSDSSSTSQQAASFTAGGDLDLTAKQDVLLVGTNLAAGGTAAITAEEGSIDFLAARETTEANSNSNSTNASVSVSAAPGTGEYGGGGGHSEEKSHESTSTGTVGSINATNIQLQSKGDITLEGTNMAATEELGITTEGSLDYQAVEDTTLKTKEGMSVQVDASASKTGGSLNVAGSGTDEFEQSSTKTGGTLSAGNLTITTGTGARLEGTEVTADSASIDTGSGSLVIESAVSTHTKTVNNASAEVGIEADIKEQSGAGSVKVNAEFEDTEQRTNQNASLNIGGNLEIKGDGGVEIIGKDITGLDSVVTAGNVDVDESKISIEQRTDLDKSEKSKIDVSVGVIVPGKKARDKVSEKAKEVSNSDVGTKLKNKATDASTSIKNIGKDADTKLANKDKATETKQNRKSDQADFKANLADKQTTKTQNKQDQKANYDQQKADTKAEKQRDKEIAAIDKDASLPDAQKQTQKTAIETTFADTKKTNADQAADTKKQNAQTAADTRQVYADKTETRKTDAANKAADSKTQHAEDTADRKIEKANKLDDASLKDKQIVDATTQKTEKLSSAQSEKDKRIADIQSETTKQKEEQGIRRDKQQADIVAHNVADQKIQDVERQKEQDIKAIENDAALTDEQKETRKEVVIKQSDSDVKDINKDLADKKTASQEKANEDLASINETLEKEKAQSARKRDDKKSEIQLEKAKADVTAERDHAQAQAESDKQRKSDEADTLNSETKKQADEQYQETLRVAGEKRDIDLAAAKTVQQEADKVALATQKEKDRTVEKDAVKQLNLDKKTAAREQQTADQTAKDSLKQQNEQVEAAIIANRTDKLKDNLDEYKQKLEDNKTAYADDKDRLKANKTALDELKRKNKQTNSDVDADRTTQLALNKTAFDAQKTDNQNEYDQKIVAADTLYADRQIAIDANKTDYDDAKTINEAAYNQADTDATAVRDATNAQADTDKADKETQADLDAQNSKDAATNEADALKSAADTDYTANKKHAEDSADVEKVLASKTKVKSDAISDAELSKAKEDRRIREDSSLTETQRADKLKDNAETLADTRKAADEQYARDLHQYQKDQNQLDKAKEIAETDRSGLSDAEKDAKKDEINTKYDDLATQQQDEYNKKKDLIDKEADTAKAIAAAEHQSRIDKVQSDSVLAQAKTDANDARDTADQTSQQDKDNRQQAADTEKQDALDALALQTGLTQAQIDEKKADIDTAYDRKIEESGAKYKAELAQNKKVHDTAVAEASSLAKKEQAIADAAASKEKAKQEAVLTKEREDYAVKNDPSLTDAQRNKKLDENQRRYDKSQTNADTRFSASEKIANAQHENGLALAERDRQDALVDADASLTDQQKADKKAENQKAYLGKEKTNNKAIAGGQKAMTKLLSSAEKKALARKAAAQAKASSGKNPYSFSAKANRKLKEVIFWKNILTSVSVGIHINEFKPEDPATTGSTTPLLDALALSTDVNSEDKALAMRALRDPDVQNAAIVQVVVGNIQSEVREQTLQDITLAKTGSERGVLTPADKREILEANGVDVDSVSLIDVVSLFDAYLDSSVEDIQPTTDQKAEILKTLGKDKADMTEDEIIEAFDKVQTDGSDKLKKVVTGQMKLPDSKVQELEQMLFLSDSTMP